MVQATESAADTILEAADTMLQHHVSGLPVVDAAGKLVGKAAKDKQLGPLVASFKDCVDRILLVWKKLQRC